MIRTRIWASMITETAALIFPFSYRPFSLCSLDRFSLETKPTAQVSMFASDRNSPLSRRRVDPNSTFISPRAYGEELDFRDNEVLTFGKSCDVKWRLGQGYPYTIALCQQQSLYAIVGLPIFSSRRESKYDTNLEVEWLVTPQDFNLTISSIFFLALVYETEYGNETVGWRDMSSAAWIPHDSSDPFSAALTFTWSHYFNITMPVASPSISNTTAGSINMGARETPVMPIALGLGLGLGIPLLLLSALVLFVICRRERPTNKPEDCHQIDPLTTVSPTSPSHHSTLRNGESNSAYQPFSDLEVVNYSHETMTRSPVQFPKSMHDVGQGST